GYGDMAPKTVLGRVVTGCWIVISIVMATSLIAGIASTLTLSGIGTNSISTAEQLAGRNVAAVTGSPGETFARVNGARVSPAETLEEAYGLLDARLVDAIVFAGRNCSTT